jgi:ABC-type Fe3+ transport system substrate-binding protein
MLKLRHTRSQDLSSTLLTGESQALSAQAQAYVDFVLSAEGQRKLWRKTVISQ